MEELTGHFKYAYDKTELKMVCSDLFFIITWLCHHEWYFKIDCLPYFSIDNLLNW